MINSSEFKEKFRVIVESGTYAVEYSGDVFAHIGPIWAIAVEVDFFGGGEKTRFFIGNH